MTKDTTDRLSADERQIGDFERVAEIRRERMLAATMSERLARLDELCRQMSTVKLRPRER